MEISLALLQSKYHLESPLLHLAKLRDREKHYFQCFGFDLALELELVKALELELVKALELELVKA
jgi:hypothetical protein